MAKTYNIRREADRAELEAKGFKWVTTIPRGENIGQVISKHKTYDLAEKAARGREVAIRDVLDTTAGAR
ncbi:hypothetical protein [Martelella sp. FOR1707]